MFPFLKNVIATLIFHSKVISTLLQIHLVLKARTTHSSYTFEYNHLVHPERANRIGGSIICTRFTKILLIICFMCSKFVNTPSSLYMTTSQNLNMPDLFSSQDFIHVAVD